MRSIFFLLLIAISISNNTVAQLTPRQLPAKRTTASIKIDGILEEAAWKDAPAALGYTEFRPTPFKKEDSANRTEVYMLYNDEGIYLGGYCHEKTKDSISSELNGRDGFGNNDYVGFIFDTYKDKINAFEYFITPLGEQMDSKMSPNQMGNSEDFSWNAVWKSAAKIHDDGWSFEIFIPFSAIRFSKKKVQDWGLNITRRRQKTGQQVVWNPIDVNINGFLTQEGFWTGLENIKPPLRLQFSPYFSTYVNHYPSNTPGKSNWTSSVNGGMDVKYGISQALTLDMTLIPDFGQVQSDNQVLNLTPFEVKFNENRAFFTEGTELFNKGNYFYSRRVGGTPLHYYDVNNYMNSNEHIIKNPGETKLINATKVSGRLQNGLGIGFFNAITSPQYAKVEDDAKNQRKIQTSPLTNYNIIVLNQSLKHNSSISFVNTSVCRSGNDYDADVTAALFDFNDKKNTWNVGGKVATSNLVGYLPGNKTQTGYSHNLYFGKTSGRFNFNIGQELTNNKFNSNDLGYFTFNNFLNHSAWFGYRWTKPTQWYNNIYLNFNAYYSRRLLPAAYRNANFNANVNGQLKNLWYVGALVGYEPKYNDFNDPRVDGRVFKGWTDYFVAGWFESNQSKKYSVFSELFFVSRSFFKSKRYQLDFGQKFRFSNKFSVNHRLSLEPQTDNVGFASIDGNNNIIFGRRDRNTVENTLGLKYNFNDKMGINTRIRHYWSKADYSEFFTLLQNGDLEKNNIFNDNVNQNVNFFNIDMTYTWEFAPGSFINIVWKNAVFDFKDQVERSYFKNFNNTIEADQNNNLSLKVIYFLDYLQLKNHKKKKGSL
ncbi:MAG: carbohydrate binding family 9 domain-containing protein [Bacteroidota bacterium]|nr:carbohydrate binding family 9 domain-containing protein [Bacteroidota bacterium]